MSEPAAKIVKYSNINLEKRALIDEILLVESELCQQSIQATQEILEVEKKFYTLGIPYFKKRFDLFAKIPNFWLTVFVNHHLLSSFLDDVDKEVLKYLKNMDVQEFEDSNTGYKINFHFDMDKNPFFENDIISKEFHFNENDFRVSCKSTQIKWKVNQKNF